MSEGTYKRTREWLQEKIPRRMRVGVGTTVAYASPARPIDRLIRLVNPNSLIHSSQEEEAEKMVNEVIGDALSDPPAELILKLAAIAAYFNSTH